MEHLLHYVWKHKLFPLQILQTTEGLRVEVIDSGLQNSDAGPDFFNAKLKIDGTPCFLVNGLMVRGALSEPLFEAAVDIALEAAR